MPQAAGDTGKTKTISSWKRGETREKNEKHNNRNCNSIEYLIDQQLFGLSFIYFAALSSLNWPANRWVTSHCIAHQIRTSYTSTTTNPSASSTGVLLFLINTKL